MRNEKNTALARKLAKIYEVATGVEFPGGITNASIRRTYAGHIQKACGAWIWHLDRIDKNNYPLPYDVGSEYRATEVAKKPTLLDTYWIEYPHDRYSNKAGDRLKKLEAEMENHNSLKGAYNAIKGMAV